MLVRQDLLYGLETMALTKRQNAELEVTELKIFFVSEMDGMESWRELDEMESIRERARVRWL